MSKMTKVEAVKEGGKEMITTNLLGKGGTTWTGAPPDDGHHHPEVVQQHGTLLRWWPCMRWQAPRGSASSQNGTSSKRGRTGKEEGREIMEMVVGSRGS